MYDLKAFSPIPQVAFSLCWLLPLLHTSFNFLCSPTYLLVLLLSVLLVSYPKHHCHIWFHEVSPLCFLRVLVLALMLGFLINLELIFYMVKMTVQHSFACSYPIVLFQAICWNSLALKGSRVSEGEWVTVLLTCSRNLENLLSSYFYHLFMHSFIHSFIQHAVLKIRAHSLVKFRKFCGIRWGKEYSLFSPVQTTNYRKISNFVTKRNTWYFHIMSPWQQLSPNILYTCHYFLITIVTRPIIQSYYLMHQWRCTYILQNHNCGF